MSLISTDWFIGLTIAFEYVATVEQGGESKLRQFS